MTTTDKDCDFLKGLTILYVEDEPEVRDQLAGFLRRRAARLILAENGEEGLESFRRHRPQLVVTDIRMPVMDGLTMAREIRALDAGVPLIVTTAFEQTDYLLRSIDIGVDKYVTKPIDVERLSRALCDCAHRLRGEKLLARQRQLDYEALRTKQLEAMGTLAGSMAHDFNNLLQVILGYLSLAQVCAEPKSKVRELLDHALDGFSQARELGDRLRLLGNADDPQLCSAPLARLLQAVVEEGLAGAPVTALFEFPDDLPEGNFDAGQLRQVFACLTDNAREAMPGGGSFTVAARAVTVSEADLLPLPAGRYLLICFRDTGRGIRPEHLPRIFDPYFTTKELGAVKGVGLSLALCHAIVWRHRGMLSVESAPGAGASFFLYLPAAQE